MATSCLRLSSTQRKRRNAPSGNFTPLDPLVRRRYEASDVEKIILTDPRDEAEETTEADEPEAA
ncbi:hypothetical protein [Paenarthrobacter sp. YJN-5]|uniref:hypothetical protein n=1 Tax=Paenarthrobacter sp. YJN-5 TaxID=2735316 RepID=UPI001878DD0B|nr:hypothetical protein [Paenarthrobacter sp. YJN-5]QOT19721.1 hypothetical protein HMI59_24940 [Paenarthrobacter sp. YJN-5]